MIILGTLFVSVLFGVFVAISNKNPNNEIPKYVTYEEMNEYKPVYLVSSEHEVDNQDSYNNINHDYEETSEDVLQENASIDILDEIFASVKAEEVHEVTTASEFSDEMEENLNLLMTELKPQPINTECTTATDEEINVPVVTNESQKGEDFILDFDNLLTNEPPETEMVSAYDEPTMEHDKQSMESTTSLPQEDIEYLTELYGGLVDFVTTTPDIGRKNDVDIMIGQILKEADQLYIAYRKSKVLVGKSAKFFVGETVIVSGSFAVDDSFILDQIKLAREAADNIKVAV